MRATNNNNIFISIDLFTPDFNNCLLSIKTKKVSSQDNVHLAINIVALSPLQHIVNGLMGDTTESCMSGGVGARAAFELHTERSERVIADLSECLYTEFSLVDKVCKQSILY